MSPVKVIVPVKEEILRSTERRKSAGMKEHVSELLAELVDLGYEFRLRRLYRRFEEGEISLEYFAQEMGLGIRELYAILEEQGWPTSNITLPTYSEGSAAAEAAPQMVEGSSQ